MKWYMIVANMGRGWTERWWSGKDGWMGDLNDAVSMPRDMAMEEARALRRMKKARGDYVPPGARSRSAPMIDTVHVVGEDGSVTEIE